MLPALDYEYKLASVVIDARDGSEPSPRPWGEEIREVRYMIASSPALFPWGEGRQADCDVYIAHTVSLSLIFL
jgi:hypothetical protein